VHVYLQLLPSSPQSISCRQCVNMDAPISKCTISERRAVMRFLWSEEIKPSGIHRRMLVQYGDKCIGQRKVYEWVERFKNGRMTDRCRPIGLPSNLE
jgi:hypothetical protein